jgi:hypothetical protein
MADTLARALQRRRRIDALCAVVLVGPGHEQHFRRVEGLLVHVLGSR